MHNVALSWRQAACLTWALIAVTLTLRHASRGRLRALAPYAGEAGIIAGLYALWQLAGEVSLTGTSGAFARAEWIERVEQSWLLPSERGVQGLILGHPLLIQAANLYYATMHFGALFVFLVWLFVRHRDRYPVVRTVLALTTLACLLVQLMPVAPPRLLPGYVDTAIRYGQSVYTLGLGTDELSAMPSVHVAWAVLIGWYVVRIGRGRWRWLGPVHAVLTVFVVVATANHFWADGIIAVAVLAACAWGYAGLRAAAHRLGPPRADAAPSGPAVPVAAGHLGDQLGDQLGMAHRWTVVARPLDPLAGALGHGTLQRRGDAAVLGADDIAGRAGAPGELGGAGAEQ